MSLYAATEGEKMKKIFLSIGLILLLSFGLFADEYTVFAGNAYTYNSVWKNLDETQFLIRYDDEENIYYLFTSDWLNKIWIYLSEDDLQTIRNTIAKYQDWVKIAKENRVEIDKEIPNSSIRTKVVWLYGDDDWYSASGLVLVFEVLSQNSQRHQLVITSNKVESYSNEFIDVELEPLYFDESEAQELLNGISTEKIEAAKEEHNKKKEAQDLFN